MFTAKLNPFFFFMCLKKIAHGVANYILLYISHCNIEWNSCQLIIGIIKNYRLISCIYFDVKVLSIIGILTFHVSAITNLGFSNDLFNRPMITGPIELPRHYINYYLRYVHFYIFPLFFSPMTLMLNLFYMRLYD